MLPPAFQKGSTPGGEVSDFPASIFSNHFVNHISLSVERGSTVTALLAVLFSPPISRGEVFAPVVKCLAKSPFSYSAVIRFYAVRHP